MEIYAKKHPQNSSKTVKNSTKTLCTNTNFYLLRTTGKTYLKYLRKKLNGSVHIKCQHQSHNSLK